MTHFTAAGHNAIILFENVLGFPWDTPIQIRPVSQQAGPKINDKCGKDK